MPGCVILAYIMGYSMICFMIVSRLFCIRETIRPFLLDQDTFNQAGIQTHLLPLHQAHSYKDYTCGLVSPAYPHSCLMDVDININILSILKSMAI